MDYTLLATARGAIIFDGQSLSVTRPEAPTPWPDFVQSIFRVPQALGFEKVAVGGQTTADMLAHFSARVLPHKSPHAVNVVVAWEGTNDLFFGADEWEAIARIIRYAEFARSNGFKVVSGTMLPRSETALPASFEARRQNYNATIRKLTPGVLDAVIDFGADSVIGAPGAQANPTWFCDGVHQTQVGAALYGYIAAPVIGPIVLSMMGQP